MYTQPKSGKKHEENCFKHDATIIQERSYNEFTNMIRQAFSWVQRQSAWISRFCQHADHTCKRANEIRTITRDKPVKNNAWANTRQYTYSQQFWAKFLGTYMGTIFFSTVQPSHQSIVHKHSIEDMASSPGFRPSIARGSKASSTTQPSMLIRWILHISLKAKRPKQR